MTVTYTINYAISPELETWLSQQADFVSIDIQPTTTYVYYDHASEAEELAFKALLAQQIGLAGENVNTFDTDLFTVNGVITPAGLSGNVDDYDPDDYDNTTTVIRQDTNDEGYQITGLVGGYEGRIITIHNLSDLYTIILLAEVGSIAENRFKSNLRLSPNSSATLRYDGISERWRSINTTVPDGSISVYHLANDSVTTAAINDGDVTTDKLDDQAVTEDKLDFGAVTTDIIADDAIIVNKIDDGAVETSKILDGNVTGAKLATDTSWNLGTTTGVKIGTATSQKLGFYNATPIVQPSANADTSGATLGQLETEVNELKALLRSLGLLAP